MFVLTEDWRFGSFYLNTNKSKQRKHKTHNLTKMLRVTSLLHVLPFFAQFNFLVSVRKSTGSDKRHIQMEIRSSSESPLPPHTHTHTQRDSLTTAEPAAKRNVFVSTLLTAGWSEEWTARCFHRLYPASSCSTSFFNCVCLSGGLHKNCSTDIHENLNLGPEVTHLTFGLKDGSRFFCHFLKSQICSSHP